MSRPFEFSKTQLLQEKRREFELVLRAPLRKTKQRTREKTFRAINFMARQTPCCCSTARIYPIIFIFVCIVKQTKTEKIESLPYNKHRRFRTYCGSYFGERSFFFFVRSYKAPRTARRRGKRNKTKTRRDHDDSKPRTSSESFRKCFSSREVSGGGHRAGTLNHVSARRHEQLSLRPTAAETRICMDHSGPRTYTPGDREKFTD